MKIGCEFIVTHVTTSTAIRGHFQKQIVSVPDRPTLKDWLRHAFAVDDGPLEPTPPQQAIAERLCREVVRRHLTTPALAFLEMSRPMNFLGAQAIHFFSPLLSALSDAQGHRHFAEFLEHRGSIEYLCRKIEELETEATRRSQGDES